jgi:hypothetical protein
MKNTAVKRSIDQIFDWHEYTCFTRCLMISQRLRENQDLNFHMILLGIF